MSRYTKLPPEPEEPLFEGDASFTGMNMALERAALAPGQYALAINKRCSRGSLETRPGTLTPVHANIEEFPEILGSGKYSNPNGEEGILVATPTEVRIVADEHAPKRVKLPVRMTLSGHLEFSQQFDKVLLHRGADPKGVDTTTNTSKPDPARLTLQWDGKSTNGFQAIKKSNSLSERALLPNADWAINFGSRAIVAVGKDRVVASDLNDYTLVDLILNTFRVNAGTADAITGLYPYAQGNIIVGKERSIDLLHNFFGDLSTVTAEILSTEIGIAARRTGKMVGSNFVFLSKTGVYSLAQVDTKNRTTIEVSAVPLGAARTDDKPGKVVDPIAPLIKRIHWPYAKDAVAAVLAPYYFLAVPLDESRVNNTILVFNTATQQWEGYDTWDAAAGFQIDNLLVADYAGQPSLYAINHAGKSIHILYRGHEDELGYDRVTGLHRIYPIRDRFESRAYNTVYEVKDGKGTRDFKRVLFALSTWRPRMTLTALMDGRNDERPLTTVPLTKNPREYYRFGMAPYDLTNGHDDFHARSREDYSIGPPAAAGVFPGKNGITPDWKQNRTEPFSLIARGRYVSYRIENDGGQCDINGILLESQGQGREVKRAA